MSKLEPFKPKVLFIMHLPPPIHGAAIASNYIKTSNVINNQLDATYINLATNKKLNQSGKGSIRKLLTFFTLVQKVIFTLSKNNFDICHVSLTARGPGFYKDLIIVSILKISGNNIVYHFHNKGVAEASKNLVNRLLYHFAFHKTKSILLSPFLYSDISMYVKESDVFYCPYGIPPITNCCNHNYRTHKNNNICKFLFLANMMSQKGAYVLLEAVKELKDKKNSFECHFVGAWTDIKEDKFRRKIEEDGLAEMVFVHGPKYGSEKNQYFDEVDVFVFPTFYHYEAFPIVNLEAMQHGLPIVSTLEGGIPSAVVDGETGFLVPQRNSKQLAERLQLLIYQPELRKKMGIAGKERFEELFTLKKFEDRLVQIINDVIQ